METHLWKASEEKLNKSNLALYCDFIKQNYKINLNNNFNYFEDYIELNLQLTN